MASVGVTVQGKVIHAMYVGTMTMDLVKEAERKIEEAVLQVKEPRILYDTRAMDTPTMALALEMKSFDSRVAPRVVRCATVVPSAAVAFMSKVAFVFSREHKVFYHDLGAALEWLQS